MVAISVFVSGSAYSESSKAESLSLEQTQGSGLEESIPLSEPDSEFKQFAEPEMYRQALIALSAGAYQDAEMKFAYFTRRYPLSMLVPSATYWRGKAFYGMKDFERASEQFRVVSSRYPDSKKAPGALLQLGFCKLKLDSRWESLEIFEQVIVTYPSSPAALRAERELDKGEDNKTSLQGNS